MWVNYPTRDNLNRDYKFCGFEINKGHDLEIWNRNTYSFLDFLGDLGGLYDALQSVCLALVAPFSSLALS